MTTPSGSTFTFARYKFVAKMMSGRGGVLEIGCADAFATRIVRQEVSELTAVDFDPIFVEDVNRRMSAKWPFTCFVHDVLEAPVPGQFDGITPSTCWSTFAPTTKNDSMGNLVRSLAPHGVVIIGMPSLELQPHASPISRAGHVNCKSMPDLRACLEKFFHNVFVFSMNDETVHTGYHKMAHYLLALCCERR